MPSETTPLVGDRPAASSSGDVAVRSRRSAVTAWFTTSPNGGMPGWVVVAFALAGIVLRIWILRSPLGDADSDEAVTGLMAVHALHGHFRALYWGANYAGTFEVLLTAGVFGIVGPSTVALKAVPIGLSFVAAFLMWRVGREYMDDQSGRLAAIVFWIFPGATVLLLMKAQVVYASGTCFVLVALLLARRLRERPTAPLMFLFGLVGGLCLWATPLLLAVYLPIAATVLVRTWRTPLLDLAAVPGAVLGALPWLWFSLHTHWSTLDQLQPTVATTYRTRLEGGVLQLYPLLLGLRKPLTKEWIVGPLFGRSLYVIIVVAGIVVAAVRYRAKVLPILAGVVLFPFLYAFSHLSYYWTEPRHGTLVSPLLLLLAVGLVPRRWPAQVLVGALCLLLTVNVVNQERDWGELSGSATVSPGKLAPVVDAMNAQGFSTCYADYWIAFRINFETDEDIICAPLYEDRYPAYTKFALENDTRVYLFLPKTVSAQHFVDRLHALNVGYRDQTLGNVRMFVLDRPMRPDQIG